jgi:hypothetical protein
MHTTLQSERSSFSVREFCLMSDSISATIDTSSSCSSVSSREEGRVVFGHNTVYSYKIKAGVTIPIKLGFSLVEIKPSSITLESLTDESIIVRQRIYITKSGSLVRRVLLNNTSQNHVSARLLFLLDPCFSHFSNQNERECVGVNAFNRGNHVVMDEFIVGSVRIAGVSENPEHIFMTKDKDIYKKVVSMGKIPDSTFGISSQPIIMFENNLELKPVSSKELVFSLVYSNKGIEEAFEKFKSSFTDEQYEGRIQFHSSDKDVETTFRYSLAVIEGLEQTRDTLDMAETLGIKLLLFKDRSDSILGMLKNLTARDGFLPHSLDWRYPGLLETSILMTSVCNFLISGEKKIARKYLPWLRKVASFITKYIDEMGSSNTLPQGWRRASRYGLPFGITSEALLSTISALNSFSNLCMKLGRPEESATLAEEIKILEEKVYELTDETGKMALFVGKEGNKKWDDTIDQAVGCYRFLLDRKSASYYFQIGCSEDFETGFGPRTVPLSNSSYFHPSAAKGQVGGYWTRASIAHCILGYRLGLTRLASDELCRISALIAREAAKMGGRLGDIPYSIDTDSRKVILRGSDAVAAARYVEAILLEELGLRQNNTPKPAESSKIEWMLAYPLMFEGCKSILVLRSGSKSFYLVAGNIPSFDGRIYSGFRVESSDNTLMTGSFHCNGQVIFALSRSGKPFSASCTYRVMDSSLFGSVVVELFNPDKEEWIEYEKINASQKVSITLSSERNSWVIARLRQTTC